jgi:predicted ATP-dependent serine protease
MVKEIKKNDENLYVCEECGLVYKERRWAEQCEEFCSKYHSCSLEITRHAVQMNAIDSDK